MKIWSSAEDQHLLAVAHMPAGRVARRFNCTVDEVRQRVEELRRGTTDAVQVEGQLPKGVTAQMIQAALSPVQRDLIEASAHYKALGEKLQELSNTIGAVLAEVELADLIARAMKEPRTAGETSANPEIHGASEDRSTMIQERSFVRFVACNAFILHLQLNGHRLKMPYRVLQVGEYVIKQDGEQSDHEKWTVLYIPTQQSLLPLQ